MKYLGSKTLETNRLILKTQTMKEQKRLWEILMIPEATPVENGLTVDAKSPTRVPSKIIPAATSES